MDNVVKASIMSFQIATDVEPKTVEYNGNAIHYFVSGTEHGETMVFLHPVFGDHRCFDHQITDFSACYRVITVDLPGHGMTGVGKPKVSLAATAEYLSEILKTENRDKVHLVGVSLGALLAQDFALKYPEKMLSLTCLGGYSINKKQKDIARSTGRERLRWLFKMVFSMDAFRRYVASLAVVNESERQRFYESAMHFTRRSFAVMSGLGRLVANRAVSRSYPLLILSGERDSESAIQVSRRWHDEDLTNSELFVIENAGHCANMDNAEQFNEIVMRFVTKSRSRETN